MHSRALQTNETVSAPSRDTNSLTSEYTRDKLSVKWCGYFQRSLLGVLRETGHLQAEGVLEREAFLTEYIMHTSFNSKQDTKWAGSRQIWGKMKNMSMKLLTEGS